MDMPAPFTKQLRLASPYMTGNDVIILQNLLQRFSETKQLQVTSNYDEKTAFAVRTFQRSSGLTETGVLCKATASSVLGSLMSDGFKDDGKIPDGYKFKLYVPVYRDRRIETNATLFNSKGQAIYKFRIRLHGATYKDGTPVNQLTRNGNTPTGLSTFDLNSKEPSAKSFGPYPVIRVVKGLKGNSAIRYGSKTLLSNIRSGILLHTGQWPNWDASKPMPNSLGCMHCAPNDMKKIDDILVNGYGVKVRNNPFGKLPYPYHAQGIIAIEQQD